MASLSIFLLAGCKNATEPTKEGGQPSRMVQVEGGTFQMGDSISGWAYELPIHAVTIGTFYIDTTEITFEKWTDVRNWALTHGYTDVPAGRNGFNGTSNHPVTEVNWYDILKWCNARSEKDGLMPVYYTRSALDTVYRAGQLNLAADAAKWTANGYRLPTEAEWEFAARGGTSTKGYAYSGSNNIDSVAWYYTNSVSNTNPVGTKRPNELGLYDMSGNVWEWCWDWFGAYSALAQTDPKGSSSGYYRVLRGGSFMFFDYKCRVDTRNYDFFSPNHRDYNYGFRCVRDVE